MITLFLHGRGIEVLGEVSYFGTNLIQKDSVYDLVTSQRLPISIITLGLVFQIGILEGDKYFVAICFPLFMLQKEPIGTTV